MIVDGDNKLHAYSEAEEVEVRPGDIVWAKCAGYAWYPALVSDPCVHLPYLQCSAILEWYGV